MTISTHAPLARCDNGPVYPTVGLCNFNSRTSCEVRPSATGTYTTYWYFNSRTSCEVRRNSPGACRCGNPFQLTHLLRGATLAVDGGRFHFLISTHAPLARCDPGFLAVHAQLIKFQLTHLLRGATHTIPPYHHTIIDFNSRTSCEVRHSAEVSIDLTTDFNSRTSCEVRRPTGFCGVIGLLISTHAPLARCDAARGWVCYGCHNFNSRTSCEVRRRARHAYAPKDQFQLTHLLRGATPQGFPCKTHRCNFNSRTSCEVRHMQACMGLFSALISTHAPLARCDSAASSATSNILHFNSRTSCEVRLIQNAKNCHAKRISTHAPLARCDTALMMFLAA